MQMLSNGKHKQNRIRRIMALKEKMIIVGAGFMANEIVDFIEHYDLYDIVGFTVNEEYFRGDTYLGRPVYPMEKLEEYYKPDEVKLFIAISYYQEMMGVREVKFNELKARGYHFANVISPRSYIWTDELGEGNWIFDNVYIGYKAKLGSNSILRAGCEVEHYSVVGDNCFIAGNTMVTGHVTIGDRSFIGISCAIHNRVNIGKKCVVGGGCVIKYDVPDYSLCIANNATIVQRDEKSIEKYADASRLKKMTNQTTAITNNCD